MRAFTRKAGGNCEANAFRRSRYECELAFEMEVHEVDTP
jgi:hypothetical protein